METQTLGKIIVRAKVENLGDLYAVEQGALPADQVRLVEVHDALVDTGETILSMPTRLIAQLGLRPRGARRARVSGGSGTGQIYGAVRLTIQERDCVSEVIELPDDCPVRIGRILLALVDFVADPVNHQIIGNPRHGGAYILEMY